MTGIYGSHVDNILESGLADAKDEHFQVKLDS